jgi:hypothetical protein
MKWQGAFQSLGERVSERAERLKIERQILAEIGENPELNAYSGLARNSLMLTQVKNVPTAKPAVNLVLPALSSAGVFAGIRTAIEVGVLLSRRLGRKIRFVSFLGPTSKRDVLALGRLLAEDFALHDGDWELVPARDVNTAKTHENDVWIATYWTTAHALDVRCRLGLLDPNKVVYLIQDYEPSFLPASTDAFVAASTYRAGFVSLVNSSPLASALARNAGLSVDKGQVFAPQLDLERLERASIDRATRTPRQEVLFYGRPSKPRNMFNLGVATLRSLTQSESSTSQWSFVSVGEGHAPVRLGNGAFLRPLGALSWSAYFERIAKAPLMLSLQASPHPSHPPLDMVASGGLAVTNEVDATRAGLHPSLLVGNADPDELAEKLRVHMDAVLDGGGVNAFDSDFIGRLGVPLGEALSVISETVVTG